MQGYAWLQNETTGPLALSRALEVSGSAAGGVACVAELQDYATIYIIKYYKLRTV